MIPKGCTVGMPTSRVGPMDSLNVMFFAPLLDSVFAGKASGHASGFGGGRRTAHAAAACCGASHELTFGWCVAMAGDARQKSAEFMLDKVDLPGKGPLEAKEVCLSTGECGVSDGATSESLCTVCGTEQAGGKCNLAKSVARGEHLVVSFWVGQEDEMPDGRLNLRRHDCLPAADVP